MSEVFQDQAALRSDARNAERELLKYVHVQQRVSAAWRIDERMLTHRPTKEWPLLALAVGMCNEPVLIAWCFDSGESLHEPRSPRWTLQQWAAFQRRYTPPTTPASRHAGSPAEAAIGFRGFAITDLRDPVDMGMLAALGAPLHIVRIHSPRASELHGDTAKHSSERQPPAKFAELYRQRAGDTARTSSTTHRSINLATLDFLAMNGTAGGGRSR